MSESVVVGVFEREVGFTEVFDAREPDNWADFVMRSVEFEIHFFDEILEVEHAAARLTHWGASETGLFAAVADLKPVTKAVAFEAAAFDLDGEETVIFVEDEKIAFAGALALCAAPPDGMEDDEVVWEIAQCVIDVAFACICKRIIIPVFVWNDH